MKVKIDFEAQELEKRLHEAQKYIDEQMLKAMNNKYIPMRSGILRQTGTQATIIGSGKIVYTAPYARRQYYGLRKNGQPFNYSKHKHPFATRLWFEAAKKEKSAAILQGAADIINGKK